MIILKQWEWRVNDGMARIRAAAESHYEEQCNEDVVTQAENFRDEMGDKITGSTTK